MEKQRKINVTMQEKGDGALKEKAGYIWPCQFHLKKIAPGQVRQKAHGIKRNWDRALEHAAIVQEINEAEERLLGMPGSITGVWSSIP